MGRGNSKNYKRPRITFRGAEDCVADLDQAFKKFSQVDRPIEEAKYFTDLFNNSRLLNSTILTGYTLYFKEPRRKGSYIETGLEHVGGLPEGLLNTKSKITWMKDKLDTHVAELDLYLSGLTKNNGTESQAEDNLKIVYLMRSKIYAQMLLPYVYEHQDKLAKRWFKGKQETINNLLDEGISEDLLKREMLEEPVISPWEMYEDRMAAWDIYEIESNSRKPLTNRQIAPRYLKPKLEKKLKQVVERSKEIQKLYKEENQEAYTKIIEKALGSRELRLALLHEINRRITIENLNESINMAELNDITVKYLTEEVRPLNIRYGNTDGLDRMITDIAEYANTSEDDVVHRFARVFRNDED